MLRTEMLANAAHPDARLCPCCLVHVYIVAARQTCYLCHNCMLLDDLLCASLVSGAVANNAVCAREKLGAAEQKLRGAVQDKQLAVTEKAALEREVKTLKAQAGKLTKVATSHPALGQ